MKLLVQILVGGMLLLSMANAQSMDVLIAKALQNHPELKAIQMEYEADLMQKDQVGQLTQPKVGLGLPVLRPETRLGAQVVSVSVQQTFPWRGSLKAKKSEKITLAKSQLERLITIRLELIYKVKIALYHLAEVEISKRILVDNIRIYNALEQTTLVKVEAGKASISEVLRIRLKLQELEQKIELLNNSSQKHRSAVYAVIGDRNFDFVFEDLKMPELLFDQDQYRTKIASHPMLKTLTIHAEAAQNRQEVNRLMAMPSVSVGLDYSMVLPRTDASPLGNGRDILIPKVMVAVPVFQKQFRAKHQEEDLRQKAIEFRKEHLVLNFLDELEALFTSYSAQKIRLRYYDLQLKTSQSIMEILLGEYSAKGQRFDELIKLQDEILSYELRKVEALLQANIDKAGIDRLTDF